MKVFLSVGRTSTAEQEAFVVAIEKYLAANGLEPQTVGRSVIRNQQPLRSSLDCMRECAGTIIVAFERVFVEAGVDRRGSTEAQDLKNAKLTTVWNHIEAAMAYTLGQPLLIVLERGVREEGLLEKGYDWYVKSMKTDASALLDKEFIALLSDWKDHLKRPVATSSNTERTVDPALLTVSQLAGMLRPSHLWGVLIALGTLLATVAGIAYKIGNTVVTR
jgi:hypothetical protein